MKTTLLTSLSAAFLAFSALGQTASIPPSPVAPTLATPAASTNLPPAPPPVVAPVAPPPAIAHVPTAAPTVQPTATVNDLQSRIERKVKKGVHISIGDDDEDADSGDTVVSSHGGDLVGVHSSSSDDCYLIALHCVG